MKYYRIKCEIYKAEGKSWERMAEELLLSAVRGGGKEHGGKVVRLVFFTFCEDNRDINSNGLFWNNGWTIISFLPVRSFRS